MIVAGATSSLSTRDCDFSLNQPMDDPPTFEQRLHRTFELAELVLDDAMAESKATLDEFVERARDLEFPTENLFDELTPFFKAVVTFRFPFE